MCIYIYMYVCNRIYIYIYVYIHLPFIPCFPFGFRLGCIFVYIALAFAEPWHTHKQTKVWGGFRVVRYSQHCFQHLQHHQALVGWVYGGFQLAQAWLRMGSRPIESKFGVAVLEVDGLVLVYGGASWGWSRMGLGLV